MSRRLQKLGVNVGTRCNFHCAHCLVNKKDRDRDLTPAERGLLRDTIATNRPKSLLFVGGETTLYTGVVNELISAHPDKDNLKVTVTTNGHFGKSESLARKTLSLFDLLDSVQVSYDVFHKEFLPITNLKNIYAACKAAGKKFSVILTISSPMELTLVAELRKIGKFKIGVQKVGRLGDAKKNNIGFSFPSFDKNVLLRKCPGRNGLGYLCGVGFSLCCAELVMNNPSRYFIHGTVDLHLQSDFYRTMRSRTFGELARLAGISKKDFKPEHSLECALCDYIFSKVDAEKFLAEAVRYGG
jgi:hypothetical protein